jgi:hypothetical protein
LIKRRTWEEESVVLDDLLSYLGKWFNCNFSLGISHPCPYISSELKSVTGKRSTLAPDPAIFNPVFNNSKNILFSL